MTSQSMHQELSHHDNTGSTPAVQTPCANNNLTRPFIESLAPKVRKVDSDEYLDLFCYTSCTDDDPEDIKACRGLVFHDNTLVLKAFSYTTEYTNLDIEELEKKTQSIPFSSWNIFKSYEGTLIRVFYTNHKWYVSTHRRLDAFKSKWASRTSFGHMFVQALINESIHHHAFKQRLDESPVQEGNILDQFLATLDTEKQYMFLLLNTDENRIVCTSPSTQKVLHVGTFHHGHLDFTESIDLASPEHVPIQSVEHLCDYVANISIEKLQGVMVFTPTHDFKVLNNNYQYYFNIRGNQPSIKFRYLQLRMDPVRRQELALLYPDHIAQFDEYENIIYDIVLKIKNAYIKRFIYKEFVTVPSEEYAIIKLIHQWHLLDRSTNHVSTEIVMQLVNEQTATHLNKMIRRHMNEQHASTIPATSE